MAEAPLLFGLIEALKCLPGVGSRSAQRMALHLLERDRDGARLLAERLRIAADRIGHCEECRTLTEEPVCHLCTDPGRDRSVLCVVETPADVLAFESGTDYRGLYFVLSGHLSPLDGIGPEDLGLDLLAARLDRGGVKELVLATGSTVEGDVTAHYIADLAADRGVRASRIAHGVPVGGELEYVDAGTLAHALAGRRDL
jgi:recombination protein RecR